MLADHRSQPEQVSAKSRTGCQTSVLEWTPRTASSGLRSRDHDIMAFTDYGSESLVELIRIHMENLDSSSGDIGGSIVRPVRFAAVAKLM